MFRQIVNKNILALSYGIIRSSASTPSRNFSRYVFVKTSLAAANVPQSYRFYSKETNLEEMVVDYQYVQKATSDGNILIIDVREPEEVKEHGKIPNSINIPVGTVSSVLSTMSEAEFKRTYERPSPTEDTEIIFYCMIGKRAGMAQHTAFNLGYKNVKNYLGSWTDWANNSQKC